ncbi:sulfatase-like hydrolase/transferase [Saccharophagus degradans]|uniref:sulfatase-like hydrolase/transferase n=1 Tax=Saccharophagus degradans TaxID=86304 RepID=UPI001C0A12CF|nr:sulfatase-like hydrolase/transferase [Saccharophagus degradans]
MRAVVICLSLVLFSSAVFANNSETRPNILVLLLDDLGYADVGFMPNSEPDIYTPNIDALAAQGTVFSSAYVTHPYCGPSRAGLMTGRYQHAFGSQFNLADYSPHGIDTRETFMSKVLQTAGYNTGLVGKWHLGEEPQYRPNVRGFDYFYGMLGGGHVYHTKDFVRVADHKPGNHAVWQYKTPLMENDQYASEAGYDENLYITDMLSDAGAAFIERNAKQADKPFFLLMSYNAPHTPEEAKAEDEEALRKILGGKASSDPNRHTYSAMVYAVDRGVKQLVDTLKATGQYDNTLIVFLSDNGGRLNAASASNAPLRNGKTSVYEGGIRVPMFFHWPKGNLPQGTYKHVVSSLDLYPTFTDLAGATVPSTKILDGKNILASVRKGSNARENEPLYFAMHQPDRGVNQMGAVLNNMKWFSSGNGQWYFYDLNKDIAEQKPTKANKKQRSILTSLYDWTCTHTQPQWFDDDRYGWAKAWEKNAMPNWAKTFPTLHKEQHCKSSK